ncbi:hypothetical protein AX15_003809 [Amanita polypyramis BW_CC]|nr:hypothetical protein AX15_003809 [Amanita polypyramis BW_CC]
MSDSTQGTELREDLRPVCPVSACTLLVDIIFRSSDNKLFGAHSKNLEYYSDAFPPAAFASPDTARDPVGLTEPADVVKLMLCYMHNNRLPQLEDLHVDLVGNLADAGEKYFIYPLMEVCRLHMRYSRFLDRYPDHVLTYAAKYNYDDLFDLVAPKTITWNLDDAYASLGATSYFVAWVRYRERWLRIRNAVFQKEPHVMQHSGGIIDCPIWTKFSKALLMLKLSDLTEWKGHMNKLMKETSVLDCQWCHKRATRWMDVVTDDLRQAIPKASTLR